MGIGSPENVMDFVQKEDPVFWRRVHHWSMTAMMIQLSGARVRGISNEWMNGWMHGRMNE